MVFLTRGVRVIRSPSDERGTKKRSAACGLVGGMVQGRRRGGVGGGGSFEEWEVRLHDLFDK